MSRGTVRIRKMRPEDLPAAMAVLRRWNMAPVAPSEHNPDPERSGIELDHAFVALDGDAVVGTASYLMHDPQTAETASLAVDPGYRGHGLGYRLQQARLAEMKRRGVRRVRTETDRPDTIAWYIDKFGYRVAGSNPKKHDFSLPDVDTWTVLELDVDRYEPEG